MNENSLTGDGKIMLIIRNCKCRKSDVVDKFPGRERIPHQIKILDEEPEA